jgi:hypothetical protein
MILFVLIFDFAAGHAFDATNPKSRRPLDESNLCERRGSAMGDFLRGASWGAWFVLAGIIAAVVH